MAQGVAGRGVLGLRRMDNCLRFGHCWIAVASSAMAASHSSSATAAWTSAMTNFAIAGSHAGVETAATAAFHSEFHSAFADEKKALPGQKKSIVCNMYMYRRYC